MSQKAPPPSPLPVRGAQVLLGLGLAESALSVYQWSELLTLRQGGATQCGISEHINCETVWNTPFAGVSASTGVLCPTCLVTYLLTLAFAGVAWKGLPGALLPQAGEWAPTLQWTVGFSVAAYAALLVPGLSTPRSSSASSAGSAGATAQAAVAPLPATLEAYLQGLPSAEQQAISDALALYRQDKPLPALSPARRLHGPPGAPVKLVEWTDSRCPHCKALVEELAVLKKRVPEGKLSLEARQFPLDSECNFTLGPRMTDGSGIRCVAARGQVCLEDAPDYWELREKLFAAQRSLTSRDAVLDILSSGSVPRGQLEACLTRQDTERKLREDIAYARQHDLHGTPLVVVNGREAAAFPPFLYALVLADGNPDASGFSVLPAPRALQAHEDH